MLLGQMAVTETPGCALVRDLSSHLSGYRCTDDMEKTMGILPTQTSPLPTSNGSSMQPGYGPLSVDPAQ